MPTPIPAQRDPLWQLDFTLNTTRRVAGAIRAVRQLTQAEYFAEDPDHQVDGLCRADLAHLMDILASDLVAQLDAMQGQVYELQGVQRSVDEQLQRIKRG